MKKFRLIRLSVDNFAPYQIVNSILPNENEFKNSAYGLSFEAFKKWLIEQNNWSNGIDLPAGYVAQIIYWFYVYDEIVGMGKIRLRLTDESRIIGGNIGYAISKDYRGKGYGTELVKLLINEAYNLGINEILLTVEKSNPASKRAIEKAGGIVIKENKDRWFLTFFDRGSKKCII